MEVTGSGEMEVVWECWNVRASGMCPHCPPPGAACLNLNHAAFPARNAFHLSGSLGHTTPEGAIKSVLYAPL